MKPTCDLYDDFLDAVGVFPLGFKHFGGRLAFHGRAETVKCFEDNSRIKDLAATDGRGKVMVVDAGGSTRCAVLGDMIAGDAVRNGWAGIIIWGCVRDRVAMVVLDLGVMALGATPRKSARNGEGQLGLSLSIAGTAVAPGDLIVADEDGIPVFPTRGAMPDGV